MVVAELDETEVDLMEVELVMVIVMRLEIIKLRRKFKNRLNPKICLNWTFLPPELS